MNKDVCIYSISWMRLAAFWIIILLQGEVSAANGGGMLARNIATDESILSEKKQNDYTLVKQSPYVSGAWGRFKWIDIETQEGIYDFSAIDAFIDNWTSFGKNFSITVETALDGTPEWVFDACVAQGASCKITGVSSPVAYPVYWNTTYQTKLNAFIEAFGDRYRNHPDLEFILMAGFGHGPTEKIVDKDHTPISEVRDQLEAAGICVGLTTTQCDDFFASSGKTNIELTPYAQSVLDIREFWRAAFPATQLMTGVHELTEPVKSAWETLLRNDSLAKGYGLANDGGSVRVAEAARSDLLNLSHTVKVGWDSWVGSDKKVLLDPILSQVPQAGAPTTSRTYYVLYTWVVAGVGESTPFKVRNITVSPGNVLQVTIPEFETEVTSANVYVGLSSSDVRLQANPVTVDGGTWTEPVGGISTTGINPPTINTAIGSVLDLYQHAMGVDGDPKLDPSAHVSYLIRDVDDLIESIPGTSTNDPDDLEKYAEGLEWAANNFWSAGYAPTVSITSPTDGATFSQPATITVNADARDEDGTITKVEVFQGATKVGEDLTAPYSLTWSNVVGGVYSLTAKATDNTGAMTTSAAVNVTVNATLLPTVTATALDSSASEPGTNTGKFTISRTGSTTASLTVYYTMGSGPGMATNGMDYTMLSGLVTIKAGSTSANIMVMPKNDKLRESSESVVLTTSSGSAYFVGSPSSTTVTITDND